MRLLQLVLLALTVAPVFGQFELPVQLIGFPVIIIAVRIANFIKKLTYALNPNNEAQKVKAEPGESVRFLCDLGQWSGRECADPNPPPGWPLPAPRHVRPLLRNRETSTNTKTYRTRPRRAPGLGPAVDVAEVEKKLVAEMGQKVCIYEQVCEQYALQSIQPYADAQLDWEYIFRKFATSPRADAEFYLLSVFLGDIVGSPQLCRQLAKRGRSCLNPLPMNYALPYSPPTTSTTPAPARRYAGLDPGVSYSWQYYYAPHVPEMGYSSPR